VSARGSPTGNRKGREGTSARKEDPADQVVGSTEASSANEMRSGGELENRRTQESISPRAKTERPVRFGKVQHDAVKGPTSHLKREPSDESG